MANYAQLKIATIVLSFFAFQDAAAQQAASAEESIIARQETGGISNGKKPAGRFAKFTSADIRLKSDRTPEAKDVAINWNTKAWKGESVHTKFVIWSSDALPNTTVECSSLHSNTGATLSSKNVRAQYIRYVLTDGLTKGGGGCGISKGMDSSLSEDLIDTERRVSNSLQPVWLSVSVPADTKAGTYSGFVTVKSGKEAIEKLNYTVQVLDRQLPAAKDRKFHLDLWQNPYAVARVHNVQPWSAAHMKVMRPYMQMLADAGQKTITATIIHDPWNSQTYDIYGSMVKWTKRKDGSWNYDYSVFDQWVAYMKALGIGNLINCYSMIPWNLKFYYYDETAGRDTVLVAQPGTTAYTSHWLPMLSDFAKHLKSKGWFDHTTIAMDERPMEAMQKAIGVIKSADKDFKISLAGAYHPELKADLFDYCVASNQVIDAATMSMRDNAGFNTTFYTSCSEGYPNTFTFSPPAEAVWLGWFAANKGYDGYLRWAYNCWPAAPSTDSRFGHWSAGDTYFVYPGYRSSIRFERLKEGIQDYEKIRILKEEFTAKNETAKLNALNEAVKRFEVSQLKSRSAADMINEAKAVINSF
jgi:hypothetical protein